MSDAATGIRVLIVEDEPDLAELIRYNLAREGYECTVEGDGGRALELARSGGYDVMVLDLMLPGMSGLEVCRAIRAGSLNIAIIMLTAKTHEVDKIKGLETGADDYMTKPFSTKELSARIRAVLRRAERLDSGAKQGGILRIGDIEIDQRRYVVSKRGAVLDLSPLEYKLLLFIAQRRGRVFSRDQLLDSVWGTESYVEPRTVDVHIRRLRAQIEDDPSAPAYVRTRRGVGYYFSEED